MAADGRRHVLAIGGFGDQGRDPDRMPRLVAHALELSGRENPRACVLNTAMGDDPGTFVRMYSWLSGVSARPSHLQLFPMPNVTDPGALLLSQDVIFVGGGSVANLMAVWRVHGLDAIMRQAWERGIVLGGVRVRRRGRRAFRRRRAGRDRRRRAG